MKNGFVIDIGNGIVALLSQDQWEETKNYSRANDSQVVERFTSENAVEVICRYRAEGRLPDVSADPRSGLVSPR